MTRDRWTWRGFDGFVFYWGPDQGNPQHPVKVGDWVAGLWLVSGLRFDGHGPTRALAISCCRRRLERARRAMLATWELK